MVIVGTKSGASARVLYVSRKLSHRGRFGILSVVFSAPRRMMLVIENSIENST
jgi:hypothetical protein